MSDPHQGLADDIDYCDRIDRTPIDWGAAPEDVDPNEDGIGYA